LGHADTTLLADLDKFIGAGITIATIGLKAFRQAAMTLNQGAERWTRKTLCAA
jgi:hypothetical protein